MGYLKVCHVMWFCSISLPTLIILVAGCDQDMAITNLIVRDSLIIVGRDSYSDPTIALGVIRTLPEDGSTGPFGGVYAGPWSSDPSFIVHFNKYIDMSSLIQNAVTVQGFSGSVYVTPNYYPWYWKSTGGTDPGTSASPFKELIEFTIYRGTPYYSYQRERFKLGATYTVVLDSTIKDINGNHLVQPFSFSFLPEPVFRATGSWPVNGANDVDPVGTGLGIGFNSPISDQTISALQISPPMPGRWAIDLPESLSASYYDNGNRIFSFDKSYAIVLPAGTNDAAGNASTTDFRSEFSTQPFRVRYTDPDQGGQMWWLSGSIWIEFNGQLDTSTVRRSSTLTPNLTLPQYEIYQGSSGFRVGDLYGFRGNTTYILTIATTLKAFDGTPLKEQHVFSFHTAPFRINGTYPGNGFTQVSRFSYVSIDANALLDESRVEQAITFSPALSPQEPGWISNGSYAWANVSMAANTTYTMTISTRFRSMVGDTLQAPYVVRFTTGSN